MYVLSWALAMWKFHTFSEYTRFAHLSVMIGAEIRMRKGFVTMFCMVRNLALAQTRKLVVCTLRILPLFIVVDVDEDHSNLDIEHDIEI